MKIPPLRLLLALLLGPPALLGPALAQRVYWEPNAGSLAYNQESQLQLVFENCKPDGDPKLPAVDGLEMQYTGKGESFSMVNMSVTRSVAYGYAVRPTKRPEVRIPSFAIATDKGPQTVAAATYAVGNATVGRSAIPLETAAKARLAPAGGAFWAGEVFPVTYTLDLAQRFRPQPPGPIAWTPAPLTVEDWAQPERVDSTANGEARVGLVYRTRGYLATPGRYTIPAISQEVNFIVDSAGSLFSFPFSSPEMVHNTVTSNEPALTIKPLPDGAPPDFGGAVGRFTFTSKVVPTNVAVGEPITWTLELAGTGNWPDIRGLPAREVSKDFKVLQPQAKRTPAEGKLFDGTLTEDVVLIPTKPGTYAINPVSYTYFDPRSGTYQTLKTSGVTVTINPLNVPPAAAQPQLTLPAATSAAPPPATAAAPVTMPAPPAAPAGIPRDPLPGSAPGPVPLSAGAFALGLVAAMAWILPVWLLLAAWRARQTDPLRSRRQARGRLRQSLSYLRGTTDAAARLQALHAWQYDAAILLGIDHAAPSPIVVAERSRLPETTIQNPKLQTQNLQAWAGLWAEADQALYGRSNKLPETWLVRAEAALENVRVPNWQASSLFRPGNLLPWFTSSGNGSKRPAAGQVVTSVFMVALLATALHPARSRAADLPAPATAAAPNYYPGPLAAYRAGDFAAAEQAWRSALAREPADWIARHDLGLALAQQDHWPEAAAHWTSAFLLHPRDESVRWHLALGYERADYAPPDLGEFALASGPHLVARLASPAEWQWLLVAAGAMFSIGLLFLLLRAYRSGARWLPSAALAVMGAALLLAAAAAVSLHLYGTAADPRAAIAWHQVLLRSIPTEADTQQKTSALPAGTLAVVDRTFLGWVRLEFPNGQTGWVRQDDIVPLYR